MKINPSQPLLHIGWYRNDRGGETLCPPFLIKPACLRSICRKDLTLILSVIVSDIRGLLETITLKHLSHPENLELIGAMIFNESYVTVVPGR